MSVKNRSKRYQELEEKVENDSFNDLKKAAQAVKKVATADFAESIEVHVRLNIDPTQADEQFRASLVLPHGTGRETRVIVFARGEKVKEAEEAGVEAVGGEELIEKIQDGWLDFDQAVATPDMMSDVSALGPVLGPRGLMPNNKAGTVTFDVAEVVEKLKKGQMELRNDQYGIIHTIAGTDEMTANELRDNLEAILKFIIEERPEGVKGQGQYIDSIVLAPTMGPSVEIDPAAAWNLL